MCKIICNCGCNAGWKTTFVYIQLHEIIKRRKFINTGEIPKGLAPFQPDTVSFEAVRIMLNRIDYLLNAGLTFAF
ncbi:MAG: hypothetical protein ACXITV_06060 [Luteibaculaceae bacterium]